MARGREGEITCSWWEVVIVKRSNISGVPLITIQPLPIHTQQSRSLSTRTPRRHYLILSWADRIPTFIYSH